MKSKRIFLLLTIIFLLASMLTPAAAHEKSNDENAPQVQNQLLDEESTTEKIETEEMIEEQELVDEALEITKDNQEVVEEQEVVDEDSVIEEEVVTEEKNESPDAIGEESEKTDEKQEVNENQDKEIVEEDSELTEEEKVEEDLVQEENSVTEKEVSMGIVINNNTLPPGDMNYIVVEKKFEGITKEQIPENFTISVTNNATNNVYELKNQTYPPESNIERLDTGNDLILRWRINNANAGTYTVSENGMTIDGYDVLTTGTGTIEVKASELEITGVEQETRNNIQNWPFVDGQFFAATLTQQAVVVITRFSLSASDRLAIEEKLKASFNEGVWQRDYYFYSVEEQITTGSGFVLNGATITYNFENSTMDIDKTSTWQHVARGNYDITTAQNPEVKISNIYSPSNTSVTIRKLITGNFGDMTRTFNFTVSVDKGDENYSFTLGHDETQTLTVRKGATLTLTEDSGSYEVKVMVGETEILPNNNGEYMIELSNEDVTITVTNHKDVIIDTGISLDSLPFVLILAVVTIGLGIMFVRRRSFSYKDE